MLDPRIAAVELLNILRPTVAVSVFITFTAHALHQFGRIAGARYQDVVARVAGRMNPGKKIV